MSSKLTAAHTPGPWISTYDTDGESKSFISEASEPNSWLAFCRLNGNEEANARLIAAAPDMLASLKDARAMLQNVEVIDGEDGDPWSKALARMDAAIAKATGLTLAGGSDA